jgi:iron complex transport system substrate-binding protein
MLYRPALAHANAPPYRRRPTDMARDRITIEARKRPVRARAGAALAGLALVAGCAPAAPAARPGSGPPTIVSLNPCLDAILVEIAPPAQVLALSHYSRDPTSSSIPAAVAARYGVTGGTAEEVIARAPDLVLASSFLPQPTRAALTRAGLRVATFGSPATIAESAAQVRAVAALVGRADKGEALAVHIAAPAPNAGPAIDALLWQPGEIVAGEQTLIAELLREEGFASHAAARGLGQADRVTLETVLADPPRVLLVAGDAPGQRHPLLAGAFKAMHIAPFDPALIYCGGPTIPKARARLRAIRADVEARS